MAHAIRLREPWVTEFSTVGPLQLRRRFQCPPTLRSADHVWLIAVGLPPGTRISLNGRPLDDAARSGPDIRHDIRALLQTRNEVVITLWLNDAQAVPIDELVARLRREVLAAGLVRLEIE